MNFYWIFIVFLLLLGCEKYELSVHQQKIDVDYLASVHVGSPDPRQAHPPMGQVLMVQWWVPRELLEEHPKILLHVIFWDYTEKTIEFTVDRRIGYETYFIINEDFETTKGALTYKAELVTESGEIYREWKHQLWVKLIRLDEEETTEESIEESNASVESQSKQGSVIET